MIIGDMYMDLHIYLHTHTQTNTHAHARTHTGIRVQSLQFASGAAAVAAAAAEEAVTSGDRHWSAVNEIEWKVFCLMLLLLLQKTYSLVALLEVSFARKFMKLAYTKMQTECNSF